MRLVSFILLAVLFLSSCQKEDRIARKLDGTWKVERLSYKLLDSVFCDTQKAGVVSTQIMITAGGLEFSSDPDKGHQGTGNFYIERPFVTGSFPWTLDFHFEVIVENSQERIEMHERFGGDRIISFDIIEQSGKKMKLEHGFTYDCTEDKLILYCVKD